ncbi:uncharacterized protein VTP21DRAFT_2750 [Calcarisporiella thermophila]|uniref:uncharacterized protein n=1 Tax=Calcarisporiella thermophila TaxID=911321 RepID=UPI0037441764
MATLEKSRKLSTAPSQESALMIELDGELFGFDDTASKMESALDNLLNESFDEVDYSLSHEKANPGENSVVDVISEQVFSTDWAHLAEQQYHQEVNSKYTSPEMLETLHSLKHICLIALDSLLRQIVASEHRRESSTPINNYGPNPRRTRSRSYGSGRELLASIERNARRLSTPDLLNVEMSESSSSAIHEAFIQIHERLGGSNRRLLAGDDYDLACSLAALLSYIYQFLELSKSADDSILQAPCTDDAVFAAIQHEVSTLRDQSSQIGQLGEELHSVWTEIQKLMEIVSRMCQERDRPPSYSSGDGELAHPSLKRGDVKPPSYTHDYEKCQRDLECVLSAIERVQLVVPPMDDQRVELTDRQVKEISVAAIAKLIDRLSRGRLEEQRAIAPPSKLETLNKLIELIRQVAGGMDDQRVVMSAKLERRMEEAKLHAVLDRFDRGRMANQDFEPREQILLTDMQHLIAQLIRTDHKALKFEQQRYEPSAGKERDMFVAQIMGRVGRMNSWRMHNQDAEPPKPLHVREAARIRDLEDMFAQLERSSRRTSLDGQRAALRPKAAKSNFDDRF